MRSHASWSNRCRGASCSCAARSARTILLVANVVVIGVAGPRLYLSLARPSRKLAGVRPTARAHPRRRGDQPGAVGGRGRGGPAPLPRYHGHDPRDGAGGAGRGHRGRGADLRREHAPQSDVLPFVVVQVIVALYAGLAARAGLFRSLKTAVPTGLGLGVIASLTSTPISYLDRKSTRLNSSHGYISYAVFCLKKKNTTDSSSSACALP